MKKLGVNAIRNLLKSVDCVLMTQTIGFMISQVGYVFDGLIGSTGLSNALLYRVFKCNPPVEVLCAKVYLEEEKALDEALVSSVIHDPNPKAGVVHYNSITVKHIHINQESIALLMPLYHASLEDVLEAFQNYPLPFAYFNVLAKGILAAVSHFHSKNYCHCDIKPANVMVSAFLLKYQSMYQVLFVCSWTMLYHLWLSISVLLLSLGEPSGNILIFTVWTPI